MDPHPRSCSPATLVPLSDTEPDDDGADDGADEAEASSASQSAVEDNIIPSCSYARNHGMYCLILYFSFSLVTCHTHTSICLEIKLITCSVSFFQDPILYFFFSIMHCIPL